MRRGISLLEVLISIFVILVGLLGVTALIPIGHSSMMKAVECDRSAALGRATLQQIRVVDLLDPVIWHNADGTDFDETQTGTQAFVLDPLYSAHNATTAGVNWLPLAPNPPTDPTVLPRLSVYNNVLPLAEQLCMGTDDRVFEAEDRESRPVESGFKGEYTWFATVNPPLSSDSIDYANKPLFLVSVAVCKSRDWETDPATAAVSSISDNDFTITLAAGVELPKLRRGSWVLLCSERVLPIVDFEVAHWYRITSVSDDDDPLVWHLSLSGPDWPSYVDLAGTTQPLPATAVLFDNVVGVYTETFKR